MKQADRAAVRDRTVFYRWTNPSYAAYDSRGDYRISAASAVYQKRLSADGWITYHDLAELELTSVDFELVLRNAGAFSAIPQTVSALLPAGLRSSNHFEVAPTATPARSGDRLPPLTRLRSGETVITLRNGGKIVTVRADAARYDLMSETLFLDAGVVVEGADGRTLRADEAVLAASHNGLYLPAGGEFEGRRPGPSFSVVLDDRGALSATPMQKPMQYEDMIAAREKLVLSRFAEKAPPSLRPFVTALLAASQARPAPPSASPPEGSPEKDASPAD